MWQQLALAPQPNAYSGACGMQLLLSTVLSVSVLCQRTSSHILCVHLSQRANKSIR